MIDNKICVISDLHFGIKNNSETFLNYQIKYLKEVVIAYMIEHNIKQLFILGDLFNSRKEVNIRTFYIVNGFLDYVNSQNIKIFVLAGNHDMYFQQSDEITGLEILRKHPNINIVTEPTIFQSGDIKFSMIPWIVDGQIDNLIKFYKENSHAVTFGHFEINGFELVPGFVQNHGFNRSFFANFRRVLSGHYHLKQNADNMTYIGSPFEFDWNDYKQDKGFYLYTFDKDELEFVKNDRKVYMKVHYKQDDNYDFTSFTGKVIKIYRTEEHDDALFNSFIKNVEDAQPESFIISVISIDKNETEDYNKEAKFDGTVLDMIYEYVDQKHDGDKTIKQIMNKMYNESLNEV
jgi:DNA repair exonuclease SbcCD nuclease subunit